LSFNYNFLYVLFFISILILLIFFYSYSFYSFSSPKSVSIFFFWCFRIHPLSFDFLFRYFSLLFSFYIVKKLILTHHGTRVNILFQFKLNQIVFLIVTVLIIKAPCISMFKIQSEFINVRCALNCNEDWKDFKM
jgi:hypothetical protein